MFRSILTLFACCLIAAGPVTAGYGDDITVRLLENRPACDMGFGESVVELTNAHATNYYRVLVNTSAIAPSFQCEGAGEPSCTVSWPSSVHEIGPLSCDFSAKPMPTPNECSAGKCRYTFEACNGTASCPAPNCDGNGLCDPGPGSCVKDSDCNPNTCLDERNCHNLRGSGCDNCSGPGEDPIVTCNSSPHASAPFYTGSCVEFGFAEISVTEWSTDGVNWNVLENLFGQPTPDPVCKNDPAKGTSLDPCVVKNCCDLDDCPVEACPN